MIKVALGDICKICSSKRIFESEYKENGIPFIRGMEITDGSILADNAKYECYISKERYLELKERHGVPQEGDILITAVGTIGNLCYIDKDKEFYFKDGNVIWFKDFTKQVYSKYLYYFMKGLYFKKQLECAMIGAVQKALTMVMLSKVELELPSYEEQVQIVDVLDVIDKKIENNNKINSELEAMARMIYDYWFLQFDFPDENGKPYKSFGGKMVWNEALKREIPEGWKVKRVKDCVKHINTGLNPRDNFVLGQGDIKYVTVKNLMSNGTLDFASCDTIDSRAKKIIHKRSDVAKGDILFASIAPLGRCFIVQEEPEKWDINESVFSIRPNIDMVSKEYLYLFFISQAFVRLAEFSSTGSVFYGIRISTLENMQIIIPDEDTMQKFTNYTSDILYKKYLNFIGNHELASLRDFLLPLLMNGQVGFKEC